jgi:hypothetical protein
VGEPSSSPEEESSDKVDMDDAEKAPTLTARFTLQHAKAHYNAVMAKAWPEEQAPMVSVFPILQEE